MGRHMTGMTLMLLGALCLMIAVACMLLGYGDIDRWWTNPLMWIAAILVVVGYYASKRESRLRREEIGEEMRRFKQLIARSLQDRGN